MERVAVLHFTAPPAVGGVETLVVEQCRLLAGWGHRPRLILGSGEGPEGTETVSIPDIDPTSPHVVQALEQLGARFPASDHPLVAGLLGQISAALQACSSCWVHNAFTVYLNPFLTVALVRLSCELPGVRWVAWCHDLSAVSRYVVQLEGADLVARPLPGVTYVVDSCARRQELSDLLDLPAEEIVLIRPGLDPGRWLGFGPETRGLIEKLVLLQADPLVLVPCKLLPHKNLGLAVRVAAALRPLAPQPRILITGASSPHQPDGSRLVAQSLRKLARELAAEDEIHLLPDLLGHAPGQSTVRDLMLLSDLVLLPSTEEGFGMPLLEAAALRVPVLAADIPPLREAVAAAYFSPEAPPAEVAAIAMRLRSSQEYAARRPALQSGSAFADGLRFLLADQ